jgi:glucuronosyltransferase
VLTIVSHFQNWYQLQQAGVGKKLVLEDLDYIDIRDTINFVVNNPKFRKNMRARAKHFTEQLQKPLDKAIWWIEWVIRNPESTFMNPPVFDYFRGNSLDVFFFIVFSSTIIIALNLRCFFIIYRIIKERNQKILEEQIHSEETAKKKH